MVALENLSTLFRRGNVSMHKYVNINVEIAALKSKQETEREPPYVGVCWA
jgi:hypothetical protein